MISIQSRMDDVSKKEPKKSSSVGVIFGEVFPRQPGVLAELFLRLKVSNRLLRYFCVDQIDNVHECRLDELWRVPRS
jgi:hypothetical protein